MRSTECSSLGTLIDTEIQAGDVNAQFANIYPSSRNLEKSHLGTLSPRSDPFLTKHPIATLRKSLATSSTTEEAENEGHISTLVNSSATVNLNLLCTKYDAALHNAVRLLREAGKEQMALRTIQLLLDKGANPHLLDSEDATPLQMAVDLSNDPGINREKKRVLERAIQLMNRERNDKSPSDQR